jgi:hypothetical protein
MCRKLIIEQMTQSMMKHEKESAEMADKMSSLKNQLMLVASEDGLKQKFAGVRIGKISDTACMVSGDCYYSLLVELRARRGHQGG